MVSGATFVVSQLRRVNTIWKSSRDGCWLLYQCLLSIFLVNERFEMACATSFKTPVVADNTLLEVRVDCSARNA